MPLTPVDIHNIAFNKTAMGRRGYDEEQVDAFLDELVLDLTGLIEENNELRAQLERGGAAGGPAASGMAAEVDHVRAQLDQAQREKAAVEQAVHRMRAELEQPRTSSGPMAGDDSEQQATPVLMMAQRTADGHIADARREASELMSTARREAERLSEQARVNADALERDARQRHQDALAALDIQRTAALTHIEELTRFQREYRSGLKAHVEGQLRDLSGRGPGPDAASAAETAGRADR